MWKAVSKTEDPARGQRFSLGSSLPGPFSVHILVGLDNNEMDCFRRQVSTLLVLITSNWYNQCVQYTWQTSGPKGKLDYTNMVAFELVVCLKSSHWPRVLPCPRGWSCTPWPPPPSRPPAACCLTLSAPPCTTLVVVLMSLAWCHSLFEFRSSPLWLVM